MLTLGLVISNSTMRFLLSGGDFNRSAFVHPRCGRVVVELQSAVNQYDAPVWRVTEIERPDEHGPARPGGDDLHLAESTRSRALYVVRGAKSGVTLKGQPTAGVRDAQVCWAKRGKGGWWHVCARTAKGATAVKVVKIR